MSVARAIFRRELLAMFTTPVAYVTIAIVAALLSAVFVVVTLRTGEPATMHVVFLAAGWTLLVAAPAISMRTFSEEFRQGTWETLLASPIRPWQAVAGKFVAALVFLAIVIGGPTLVLGIVLELNADPDWGEIATGLGGLLLAGGAFIALGMLASMFTSNQLVAFLVPLFVLFTLALGSRALGAALPASWAPLAFGADPLRRVEDSVLGLVDTSNIVYFALAGLASLLLASTSLARVREGGFGGRARSGLGRAANRAESALFALGALACVAAATALAGTPALRHEIDATKTRAYSLSPSTVEAMRGLPGDWTIALLVSGDRSDPVSLRRVDEVLKRMHEANSHVSTRRIDPDDASSAAQFEALLEQLAASDEAALTQWRPALDRALASYEDLRRFAREESASLQPVLTTMPADAPLRPQLEQLAAGLLQLADQGDAFIAAVRSMLRTSATQPLADWNGARSALIANDRLWSDQFATVATLARDWAANPQVAGDVRAWAHDRGDRYERQGTARRSEQYALEELPDLSSGDVGRVIGQGECAVIMSPRGAVAIPSWQIVPAASGAARTSIGFDFAARAEQTLLGAIRSLLVDRMPMICFVHAEPRSLLERTEDRSELVAVADALRTARFGVREWNVTNGERPTPARGQRTVFVIVPPLKREGLQTSDRERKLIDVTRMLIRQGESALVTFARSLLPQFGQRDPWELVAADLGLNVDTGRVVLELIPLAADKSEVRPWQEIDRMDARHPIGAAVNGQPAVLNHPTPITVVDAHAPVIASIAPSANRWLEDDWRNDGQGTRAVPAAKRLNQPAAVVVAVERSDPSWKYVQRIVAVGSGGWLLSSLADMAQSLGGNRVALANPGNRGLMLASAAWLAGLDAGGFGGTGREIARVGDLSDAARATWFIVLVGGMPLLTTLTGVGVWLRRRRDA